MPTVLIVNGFARHTKSCEFLSAQSATSFRRSGIPKSLGSRDMEHSGTWVDHHNWSSSLSTAAVAFTTILILIVTAVLFFDSPIDSLLLSLKLKRSGRPPLPPGRYGFPILGELLQFLPNPILFALRRHAKYGPIFKTNVFGKAVFLEPPAGNKFLYANDGKLVEIFFPKYFKQILGRTSLLVQTGNVHRLSRRHLMPYFNPQSLAQYVPRIEGHLQNHFKDFWRSSSGNDHEFEISLAKSMKLLMFHIIADLVLSFKPHETEEIRQLHHTLAKGTLTVPINLPGTPLHSALKARARLLEIQSKMFAERRAELMEGKATPAQDLMSYLLTQPDESGRLYSDEEIHDNLLIFVLAGHETSSSAISLTLRFLAMFPVVRQRVQDEHVSIAKKKNQDEGLTKEDLAEMKYTWWAVQESMRLHTVVGGGFRIALQDIEYRGFTIPKGWTISWSSVAHINPRFFKSPEVFDPTRFDGNQSIPPYTFVPFGGGPHVCAGMDFDKMEMLIIIYNLMDEYTFTLVDPDEPLVFHPIPEHKNGTRIRVKKRHSRLILKTIMI